jgi:hypothetical protein
VQAAARSLASGSAANGRAFDRLGCRHAARRSVRCARAGVRVRLGAGQRTDLPLPRSRPHPESAVIAAARTCANASSPTAGHNTAQHPGAHRTASSQAAVGRHHRAARTRADDSSAERARHSLAARRARTRAERWFRLPSSPRRGGTRQCRGRGGPPKRDAVLNLLLAEETRKVSRARWSAKSTPRSCSGRPPEER